MGGAPKETEIPQKCFNAHDHYQLGWFAPHTLDLNPEQLFVESQLVWVAAFVDYDLVLSSGDEEYVIVKVGDLYLQYNRATKHNIGTEEYANALTVIRGERDKTRLLAGLYPPDPPNVFAEDPNGTTNFTLLDGSDVVVSFQVCAVDHNPNNNNQVNATRPDRLLVSITLDGNATLCPPPTGSPSVMPSVYPTTTPSVTPTFDPTHAPVEPTNPPTSGPSRTLVPTIPSTSPTRNPTASPSVNPSSAPSYQPSGQPTIAPVSLTLTATPSFGDYSTLVPSFDPSGTPTVSKRPSTGPTLSASPTLVIIDNDDETDSNNNALLNTGSFESSDDGGSSSWKIPVSLCLALIPLTAIAILYYWRPRKIVFSSSSSFENESGSRRSLSTTKAPSHHDTTHSESSDSLSETSDFSIDGHDDTHHTVQKSLQKESNNNRLSEFLVIHKLPWLGPKPRPSLPQPMQGHGWDDQQSVGSSSSSAMSMYACSAHPMVVRNEHGHDESDDNSEDDLWYDA